MDGSCMHIFASCPPRHALEEKCDVKPEYHDRANSKRKEHILCHTTVVGWYKGGNT